METKTQNNFINWLIKSVIGYLPAEMNVLYVGVLTSGLNAH